MVEIFKAKELSVALLVMTIGIICGTGHIALAAVYTLLICAVMFIMTLTGFGKQSDNERYLKVTISESLNYDEILNDILDDYTSKWELESVKTLTLGSLFRADYRIRMKESHDVKKMIDKIGTRNGNLEIMYARAAVDREEL